MNTQQIWLIASLLNVCTGAFRDLFPQESQSYKQSPKNRCWQTDYGKKTYQERIIQVGPVLYGFLLLNCKGNRVSWMIVFCACTVIVYLQYTQMSWQSVYCLSVNKNHWLMFEFVIQGLIYIKKKCSLSLSLFHCAIISKNLVNFLLHLQ